MHVLLMEHIDGKDFRILVLVHKAKDVCPAHKLAMVLGLNLDALDFQPRNVIFGRRIEFCEKDDCLVRSEVDLDDVCETLVDLENVRLADLMKKLRNRAQRRRYLKRWLENGIQQLGQ